MYNFLQRLSNISNIYVHAYPNAGLPNVMGDMMKLQKILQRMLKSSVLMDLLT